MIRKTVKNYKRRAASWYRKNADDHTEEIVRETWWFLFIPVYSREILMKSNI